MWLQIVRWVARILGLLLVGMFLLFAVSHAVQGEMNLASFTLNESRMMAAMVVSLLGMLLLWRWELLGAVTSLAGIICFYAMNYAAGGNIPSGWVIPLYSVPGILSLISWGGTAYRQDERGLQHGLSRKIH